MKYNHIVLSQFGGPENLSVLEDELPEPQPNEVRVKVLAAGVSFADILMRQGVHPESINRKTPFTLGWDIVGIIDKLGENVSKWQNGQIVVALPIVGGYSEYMILSSAEIIPVPEGLDHAGVVSLVLNYTTAYQMLHRCAHIKSGETILVHGAAGGVGTALLQLGNLENLKMYGTASHEKNNVVSSLSGIPIDYKSVDVNQEIIKLTSHQYNGNGETGVDAVFDGLGGRSLSSSYDILRGGGRLVAYGPFSPLELGNWMRMFTLNLVPNNRKFMLYSIQTLKRVKPDWFYEDLSLLLDLLKQGKIKPIVAARMPLKQAAEAHKLLASGSVKGKIALICNDL
ncbi:MAG TPA: medium chain dehydrogenase/reductase family protein [Candidatus Nitrosocosmicus sp.]|nr:medium chain dehydrogenase/reductase family protein [Candidatus Nitrosocosmicus sp.]